MELRQVTFLSVGIRIAAALVVGGILGLEREKKNRAAGLRTYMLVCVGACLIMLTNQYIYQTTGSGDPMRLGAQVVSGIGFLGAGTIIVTKRNQIKGLTTAAGLWSSAAVGLSLGVGFYEAALAAGAAIYFVMTVLRHWDVRMHKRSKYMDLYMEVSTGVGLAHVLRQIRALELEVYSIDSDSYACVDDAKVLIISLKLPKRMNHTDLIEKIEQIEGMLYIREL